MPTWIPLRVDVLAHQRRRCYGAAVEAALFDRPSHDGRAGTPLAPRLLELLSQLDADGHDTKKLRTELRELLEAADFGPLPSWYQRTPETSRSPRGT